MRRFTIRFLVALIAFTIGINAAAIWPFDLSPKSESNPPQQRQYRSEEILHVLLPNDTWADVTQLDRFDHAEEIRVLKEAQVEAKNERAISIAFLLAVLNNDYGTNRQTLLDALHECTGNPQEAECLYFIADYLMELCRRGDFSLLGPLFDMSKKSDGAFSESLDSFYSDMLFIHPDQFLKTLSLYPKNTQRDLCWAAAVEDGGGMADDRFRTIRRSLPYVFDTSLRPVARTCLVGLESGHRQARVIDVGNR